ncbi:MAG TPA: hypothetical protein VN894_12320 [Polyangiaceae bacterium]|nr:hypothetical protein [Polyangiaceae bacterium]
MTLGVQVPPDSVGAAALSDPALPQEVLETGVHDAFDAPAVAHVVAQAWS